MKILSNLLKNESIKETISYLIATLFAKGISYIGFFVIVRIMTKSEVGTIELFNSNVNFLLPFISLELHECFLKFTSLSETSENRLIYRSNIFVFLILETIISLLISIFYKDKLLIFGLISLNLVTYATYFARAENHKVLFKLKEVLGTTLQYILFFVLIFIGFNYSGYIIAFIIANLLVSFVVFYRMRHEIKFNIKNISFKTLKTLFNYALPLIPNAFGWWIISSSDRWMIDWFISIESVATYSVATKFSSLIMMVLNNVYFVVQNRYFISNNGKERNQMCNMYIYITIFTSLIAVLLPSQLLTIIVGQDYADSVALFYIYAPTTMYWAFGAFYGIGSQITGKTMLLTFTMFISAIVNVVFNYALIQVIGIEGAIIGSVLSLFTWFISRYIINKKTMEVSLRLRQILLIAFVQIISIVHYFICK